MRAHRATDRPTGRHNVALGKRLLGQPQHQRQQQQASPEKSPAAPAPAEPRQAAARPERMLARLRRSVVAQRRKVASSKDVGNRVDRIEQNGRCLSFDCLGCPGLANYAGRASFFEIALASFPTGHHRTDSSRGRDDELISRHDRVVRVKVITHGQGFGCRESALAKQRVRTVVTEQKPFA